MDIIAFLIQVALVDLEPTALSEVVALITDALLVEALSVKALSEKNLF